VLEKLKWKQNITCRDLTLHDRHALVFLLKLMGWNIFVCFPVSIKVFAAMGKEALEVFNIRMKSH